MSYRERIQQLLDDAESEADLPDQNTAMLRSGKDAEVVEIAVSQSGEIDGREVSEAPPPEVQETQHSETPPPPVFEVEGEPESPPPPSIDPGAEREPPAPPDVEPGAERETPPPPELNVDVPPPEFPEPFEVPSEQFEPPQVVELPDTGIHDYFAGMKWQPPDDFGDLPDIEALLQPDESIQHVPDGSEDALSDGWGW